MEKALCDMEMRALFGKDYQESFVHDKAIDPSSSPFLRNRLNLELRADNFEDLLILIENQAIVISDFKVVSLNDQDKNKKRYTEKAIGLRIHGFPNFKSPSIVYGLVEYNDQWYFGRLLSNDSHWRKHKQKPYSYSSSLDIHLAKALVNIAGQGIYDRKLIDPCCGVGTVLLEGHHSGYDIEGLEILPKVAEKAIANLAYYNYDVKVSIGDIGRLNNTYDACIVDLPYGISTHTKDEVIDKIIYDASRLSNRVVYVSTEPIEEKLSENMALVDSCLISKGKDYRFKRYVCLCEKNL